MSKQKVIVLAVRDQGLTVTEAARRYGVSRRWVHELLRRESAGGIAAVEPRSKRPLSNPRRTTETVAARILTLRQELQTAGLDAGPVTIAWHLEQEGVPAPSTSTIRRLLHTKGMITPDPKKRPKASLGITQKNGALNHPQTQGKIERFHQTLKRWLTGQPRAHTLQDLNEQLEKFRHIYNHERPHRALDRRTPAAAYTAIPKASSTGSKQGDHWRRRIDRVDQFGKLTLRHAGQLRHIGIGRASPANTS